MSGAFTTLFDSAELQISRISQGEVKLALTTGEFFDLTFFFFYFTFLKMVVPESGLLICITIFPFIAYFLKIGTADNE